MRDEKLVELLEKEPDKGIRKLFEAYSGLVWAIVRGRLRPPFFGEEDIEECVADAFTELWLDRSKLDLSRGSIKSWLAKLALNNAYDRLRIARREAEKIPLDLLGELEDEWEGLSEEKLDLVSAIEGLGKPDSEIIVRKYLLGQSSREIAEKLRISVSCVDTRTHRAIKKLRLKMGENEDEDQ